MSSPPPTKPPRGVKQGKETSGLLMSVIRTLSASETNEQREKERAKLEKEYKKSDARLDELVAVHAQEIMDVMQKFTAVNTVLTGWGQHNDAAVARLNACRGLLRVLGDELRRLWMDLRTHHYALQMLNDIERVVVSERETREAMSCGRVLLAANTLSDALYAHDTTLAHVTALNTTRAHLEEKKHELVALILRKISEAVYMGERDLSRRLSARRRAALLLAELTKSEDVTETYLQDITPELETSLNEEDKTFDTAIVISLEALGVLSQLKEATEKFKCRIQNELLEVIEVVSRRIIDEGDTEWNEEQDGDTGNSEVANETGRPLANLVMALHDEFIATGNRNNRLIQLWRATMQKYHLSDASLHTEQHYWSAVQQVLQLLLTEYLQIESVTLAARHNPTAPVPEKLPDYFAKKVQRRKPKLFTFTAPPNDVLVRSPSRHRSTMVCPANPALLHAALPTLHALCHHIETIFGGECSLRVFITDYVRSGESERLASAARGDIDNAMRVSGAWRERGQPVYTHGKHGSSDRHRVIFTCCSAAWQAIHATTLAARRCGPCGGAEAARAVLSALATLGTHCRQAHHKLAPSHNSHSKAQRWLSDDDIVRFLQSLPNWRAATDPQNTKHNAQDLSEAYEREAEILGTNLGDGLLGRKEIISDINTLVDLAVLCESMDWLSTNIKSIPSILNAPTPGGGVKLPEKLANDIASAAMIFDEISHKCLLLLHLELRIQCFYYLGQEETTLDVEQSDGATQLAHALLSFHEHASKVLADVRRAYILDGLSEMMSAGVVWRWQGETRAAGASTGASTRLATLRHCLAALQLPHNGLHRAHDYLHILTCTPQEIITSVREKGARFSELEYLNAFKVIGTRLNIPQQEMKGYLKQLSMALGHVGVTV